jgi:hypothetical protein
MRALIISVALIGAFAAVQPAAAQQMDNKKAFCLVVSGTGPGGAKEECRYDSMAQCEESKKGVQGAKCERNTKKM